MEIAFIECGNLDLSLKLHACFLEASQAKLRVFFQCILDRIIPNKISTYVEIADTFVRNNIIQHSQTRSVTTHLKVPSKPN